jgi:hypothetical protein
MRHPSVIDVAVRERAETREVRAFCVRVRGSSQKTAKKQRNHGGATCASSRDMSQALNYLSASDVALILNFGERPEFKRVVLTNDRKRRPEHARTSPFHSA